MERKKYSEPGVDVIEELTAKLIVANRELKESEEARSRMLENISHDLRAPITAIRNSIDYLKDVDSLQKIDPKELAQILNLLDLRTKTLEVLIQDLYYLTSLDGDMNALERIEVPIGQFLEEYYFAAQMDLRYKDRTLKLEVPEDFSPIVSIDVSKMTRVLDNLFSNALKYSDIGCHIILGAYKVTDEMKKDYDENLKQKNLVAFYVRDNGMGIAKEDVSKIFDRLYRVSKSRTPGEKEVSGNGLGLAIVKSIVTKHHGSIYCESELGCGCTFTVLLEVVD